MPGFGAASTTVLELVRKWLSSEKSGLWLMVLDNADDLSLIFGTNNSQKCDELSTWLPKSNDGRILITTRDRRVGQRLVGKPPICVPKMSLSHAQSLLTSKVHNGQTGTEGEQRELIELLDALPLAITQAAAYINENDTNITTYLKLLRENTCTMMEFEMEDSIRDCATQNSLFRTWKISWDQLMAQKPQAVEILCLIAMLDRNAVWESILHQKFGHGNEFVTAIGTLKAFAFITVQNKGDVYGMHRLVRLFTRSMMKQQNSTLYWQEEALRCVAKCCPDKCTFTNWRIIEGLVPHILSVLEKPCSTQASSLHRARILYVLSWYNGEKENFTLSLKPVQTDHQHPGRNPGSQSLK